MVLNISHSDKKKLEAEMARKPTGNRKNRTSLLSSKSKNKALKKFGSMSSTKPKDDDIEVDEHVKLNDSYMRTGVYVPKKK